MTTLLLAPDIRSVDLWVSESNRRSPLASEIQARPPIALPTVGDPTTKVLLIVLIDASPSVVGGADPIGWRYEEVWDALRHLARNWSRRANVLACLRHFDVGTSSDVGPVRLKERSLNRLRDGLRASSEVVYGTSDLEPSLVEVRRLVEAYPDRDLHLFVLSDFALTDRDLSSVYARLRAFAEVGAVHAVVLGGSAPEALVVLDVDIDEVKWDSPHGIIARALCAPFRATCAVDSAPRSPWRRWA